MFAYYVMPKQNDAATAAIRPFPAGLRMIGTQVQFSCAHGGSPRLDAPFDCRPHFPAQPRTDAWVNFPTCWDGRGTEPSDVRYAGATGCPAGFGTPIPLLQFQLTWTTPNGTGAMFSTGALQARWTNGWNQQALESLVKSCLNTPTACGSVVNYFHRSPLPPSAR